MSPPNQPPRPPISSSTSSTLASASATAVTMDHQQQLQHHISHEDYDWMGVLDTLDAEGHSFDGHNMHNNVYQHATSLAAAGDQHGHQHQQSHSGEATAHLTVENPLSNQAAADGTSTTGVGVATDQMIAMASAAAAAGANINATHSPIEQQQSEQTSAVAAANSVASLAVPSLPGNGSVNGSDSCKSPTESTSNNSADIDSKKQSRIERKRTREKQRRLDTNSQFTALAEIVREIETVDLVEEARYSLSERYGDKVASLNNNGVNNNSGEDNNCKGLDASGNAAVTVVGGVALSSSQPYSTSDPSNNDSSKKLKTDNSSSSMGQSETIPTPPPPPAFNPSNRVDLIARTISQLSQFRMIRRKRTEELRDARRENCELKKECESLRRAVAHYKAVGMQGGMKPQEKVMMMVPMMVPQDAVSQIAQGYPAAHQYGATAATASPHFATGTAPWMGAMSTGAVAGYSHAAAMPGATFGSIHGMHHHHPAGVPHHHHHATAPHAAAAPGTAGAPPAPALEPGAPTPAAYPPHLHPYSGHATSSGHSTPGMHPPPAPAGSAPQPPGTPNGNGSDASAHGTHGQVSAPAPGYAAAAPHAMAGMSHQQPATMPPAMAMYPQVTNGVPSVTFGLHPHAHAAGALHPYQATTMHHPHVTLHPHAAAPAATTAPGPATTVAATASLAAAHAAAIQQPPPHTQTSPHGVHNTSPSMFGTTTNTASPSTLSGMAPPPGMAPPLPPNAQHSQPSADKPSTAVAHSGSGGNLAHCA